MSNVSKEQFDELKGKGLTFPVLVSVKEDEMEAVEIFHGIKSDYKFILEDRDRKQNLRYSYIGFNPEMAIKYEDGNTYIVRELQKDNVSIENYAEGLLEAVKKHVYVPFHGANTEFPFIGGGLGYIGYDCISSLENILVNSKSKKEMDIPEAMLMIYKNILVFDHENKVLNLIYNVKPDEKMALKDIEKYLNSIYEVIKCNRNMEKFREVSMKSEGGNEFTSNFTKEQFCGLVKKAKEHVVKGDVFQVVISQRFLKDTGSNPYDIYRRLRLKNPSPYMFYIDFKDFKLIGASPESLVKVRGREVETNPIAGTRKRGRDSREDEEIARELLQDPKEVAEHVMLVDLGRNDVGKISEFGTVNLSSFMKIENFSKVMHIVSEVKGELKDGMDAIDAFKACFPAGTVSGAPKVRAMEIIDELEESKRGFYAGAVGYFSFNGNMDVAIAIRTMLYKDKKVYIGAGAGIVYDSDPESEYKETINKAKGIMEVV
ncbi:anthranilate synthase component 1 [Hathewaya proteolytica DSM 3090]|uniref:Anthranilate synthase component 1 n=1 Tax=Hathewaya proteolytica DSM 3090 TaxID=1121331 RepID=A0A1M6K6T4_9CLOT|nr:anthranilate synthase component I [Hathewaya proteolytica]SHJ54553.1 anthranilate synthase component 1 [Hathewaya proteolytica DSM 3090]